MSLTKTFLFDPLGSIGQTPQQIDAVARDRDTGFDPGLPPGPERLLSPLSAAR